jgi:lysophospholipase L1-like esterase
VRSFRSTFQRRTFLFLIVVCFGLLSGARPKTIRWTALGDSITYLNDHTNQTGDRISKGYMTLITEKYPSIQYINKGFNGWSAVRIAQQIETLDLTPSDVYTVFLGTNDWWQGQPLGTFEDFSENKGPNTISGAFRVILDKMRALNPKAKIILITPLQRGDFVQIKNSKNNAYGSYKAKNGLELSEIANRLIEIGKAEKIPVVDLYHKSGIGLDKMVHFKRLKDPATGTYRNYPYPDYTSIPFDPEKDEYPYPSEAIYMTYDGLHPSDEGYKIIADRILKKWKGKKS